MKVTRFQGRNWVLTAMIFAVAMTFIDQTIVAIAVPSIQRELHLSSTGVQWVVNGYLLALAAFFALGGRLSDIFGHTKLCVIGVVVFVGASAMCGLTPTGSAAEGWIVGFRVAPGGGRRPDVPGRSRHRGQQLPPARAGQGVGLVLRHRRRAHGDRAGAGWLSHPVDVAGHLLGQHPRGPDRPGPDRPVEAQDRVPARPDRLPRRRRCWPPASG